MIIQNDQNYPINFIIISIYDEFKQLRFELMRFIDFIAFTKHP